MKKFSFSIQQPSKPSNPFPKNRSRTFDDNDSKTAAASSKTYVTEFNPNQPPAAAAHHNPNTAAIAPLENWDFRRLHKMKNLDIPVSARPDGLEFEPEPLSAAAADGDESNTAYGLTVRDQAKRRAVGDGGGEKLEVRRFKMDLERVPDDLGMAEFENMAVEGFGAALLAGYGWKEGKGIGKNAKEDTKVVECTRKNDKQGLGFVSSEPLPVVSGKGRRGGGDLYSDRKRKERDGVLGKEVRIVGWGREAGLKGRVVERVGDGKLAVRVTRSGEEVVVGVRDVAEIGSKEEERCLRRLKEAEKEKKAEASWVVSGIRVKVVSREVRRGALYLKKGEVVDVVGPGECDVAMEGGREVVQRVPQGALETVVPRRGGRVLVLSGKRRGVFGSLVERDSERESGVVRDADTHELVDVKFDQIAEFVGDPSDLGH